MVSLMGRLGFRMGGCLLSAGCLNELSIIGRDCKSSTKPLSSKPSPLSVLKKKIHRGPNYKESDRGRPSFPLSHWEQNRGSDRVREGREGRGGQSENHKKKRAGNLGVWERKGGYERGAWVRHQWDKQRVELAPLACAGLALHTTLSHLQPTHIPPGDEVECGRWEIGGRPPAAPGHHIVFQ